VTTEALPADIEELNRVAQQRGYLQDAFFAYDESTLSPEAQAALTAAANWLKKNPQYNLLIEGHCDERGTEQYNLALGDRRANTAKEYLMTLGVDGNRIRTVSYGEERPFDPGHTEGAWAKNRRAHLVIVGK
jgi:peptidoglycan-associated lipoprotein